MDPYPINRTLLRDRLLLLVSGLVSVFSIIPALDVWPTMSTMYSGLSAWSKFYLAIFGIYLFMAGGWVACRTRVLADLNRASRSVRLVAGVSLGIGWLTVIILGVLVLAVLAVILTLAWGAAFLLAVSRGGNGNASRV
jgi:hypothetical protein